MSDPHGPFCAHLKVNYERVRVPDDERLYSDRWACPDCGETFIPSRVLDFERKWRERIESESEVLRKQVAELQDEIQTLKAPIN